MTCNMMQANDGFLVLISVQYVIMMKKILKFCLLFIFSRSSSCTPVVMQSGGDAVFTITQPVNNEKNAVDDGDTEGELPLDVLQSCKSSH